MKDKQSPGAAVKAEVAILGSPQSSGAVWKSRWPSWAPSLISLRFPWTSSNTATGLPVPNRPCSLCGRGGRPGLPSLISLRFLWTSSNTSSNSLYGLCGRGGRPGLPVPNSSYGLCGRKAKVNLRISEWNQWPTLPLQSSGAVWKSRWPSWAPVPNKPTVSVDVKQHSTNNQWPTLPSYADQASRPSTQRRLEEDKRQCRLLHLKRRSASDPKRSSQFCSPPPPPPPPPYPPPPQPPPCACAEDTHSRRHQNLVIKLERESQ